MKQTATDVSLLLYQTRSDADYASRGIEDDME